MENEQELEGSDGDELVNFLRDLAYEDPRTFAMLLDRVLPPQRVE